MVTIYSTKTPASQNMYDMLWAKLTVWPGKLILSKKNHLKSPKIMDNFSDRLTLEDAGGQTGNTRSTFGVPLKSLGYNCSN